MADWGPYPATVLEVRDGDTLTLAVDLGFALTFTYGCRVYGINTPEKDTPEGGAARDYAKQLLAVGDRVSVVSKKWDKYGGRFDGVVTLADGRLFGDVMITAGYAKPYYGKGPKP